MNQKHKLFGIIGPSEFLCQDQTDILFDLFKTSVKVSTKTLIERSIDLDMGEDEFEYPYDKKFEKFSAFSQQLDSEAKNNEGNFLTEHSTTLGKPYIENLMEKIMPVATGKKV